MKFCLFSCLKGDLEEQEKKKKMSYRRRIFESSPKHCTYRRIYFLTFILFDFIISLPKLLK